ncbi:MAG: D-alanine--D-alanine ligase [Planctomycetota bacterium]
MPTVQAIHSRTAPVFKSTRLKRITVLAGGPGPEREVSLNSGIAVQDALLRLGYDVSMRDIHPGELSALEVPSDFIFIVLHGEFGEDGALQHELEGRGLAYCGSDSKSSRLAMNKVHAKRCFERAGIPTPGYEVVTARSTKSVFDHFPTPAVVKPVSSGSSVDTFIVRTSADVAKYAQFVAEKYGEALLERYVQGPELTVGVVGETALPVCEIRTRREFYDYQAKYIDDDTQYLFDLDLPAALLTRVQQLSVRAHQSLGCRVFSRVDWKIDAETYEPFILEVNTIPGFTDHSLLPKSAARAGIPFDQLIQTILDLSIT